MNGKLIESALFLTISVAAFIFVDVTPEIAGGRPILSTRLIRFPVVLEGEVAVTLGGFHGLNEKNQNIRNGNGGLSSFFSKQLHEFQSFWSNDYLMR